MSGPQSVPGLRGLQPALDKHHYTDPSSFVREAEMLRREWTCIGRLDDLGLAESGRALPDRRAVVTFLGESVIVTADAAGSLHAFANVCRHRGSQVVPVDPEAPARALRREIAALPVPLLDLRPRRPADACPPHRRRRSGTSTFGLRACAPRRGADSSGSPTICEASAVVDALGPVPDRVRRYPLDTLVVGRRLTYSVAANWKVIAENYNECYHCGPVHPELSRLVPAFAGGGADLAWEDGIPHREGAWTFTMSGTHRPGAVPRPRRRRTGAAQGRAGLPEPAAVAVGRARRGVRAAAHGGRPHRGHLRPAVRARRGREAGVRSQSDAGELWDLVNRQDWAICESVQRGMSSRYYTRRVVRADGGRVAWTSAAGCCPGWRAARTDE